MILVSSPLRANLAPRDLPSGPTYTPTRICLHPGLEASPHSPALEVLRAAQAAEPPFTMMARRVQSASHSSMLWEPGAVSSGQAWMGGAGHWAAPAGDPHPPALDHPVL